MSHNEDYKEAVDRLISIYQEHVDSLDKLSAVGYFHMQAVFCEQPGYDQMGELYSEMLREMVERGIPFDTSQFERTETMH